MSKAQFREVYGKVGSGRFVVSEGIAPSTYCYPHTALPTLWLDEEDDLFEIVLHQGTIISLVQDDNGDSLIVPANGTSGNWTYDDGEATPDTVTVLPRSIPVGVTQQNIHRQFDKGESMGTSWLTRAFVEWPMVDGLNDDLVPGNLIRADAIGRPVKCSTSDAGTYPWLVVGKVVEVETFASNFDDGLLSYMRLPADPGNLREVYALTQTGDYQGKLGVRSNLDVAGSVGAFRATINL